MSLVNSQSENFRTFFKCHHTNAPLCIVDVVVRYLFAVWIHTRLVSQYGKNKLIEYLGTLSSVYTAILLGMTLAWLLQRCTTWLLISRLTSP